MTRTFEFEGDDWEAEGTGTALGFGGLWGAHFHCISDPSKADLEGDIRDIDPDYVSDEELIAALRRALRKSDA